MKLWRTVPFDRSAEPGEPGGALWFPREAQGSGRHDNPHLYGCLYVTEDPLSAVAEPLSEFRGLGQLTAVMFRRLGLPLAVAELELPDDTSAVNLDNADTLVAERLRPSRIATNSRSTTQRIAADLFQEHPEAVGIRWWSTIEGSWINWTLFDRAIDALTLVDVVELRIDDEVVQEAADLLGMAP
jgi:RES domain